MRVLRRSRKRLISISLRRCLTIPLRALTRFQILILSAEFFVHAVLFRALRTLAAFKAAVHAALRALPVPVFADVVYGIADAHRFALLTDCHDIVLSAL